MTARLNLVIPVEMKVITFKMNPRLLEILDIFCQNRKEDRSRIIRKAIMKYILDEINMKQVKTEYDLKVFNEILEGMQEWT